jgi:hypothetical protein
LNSNLESLIDIKRDLSVNYSREINVWHCLVVSLRCCITWSDYFEKVTHFHKEKEGRWNFAKEHKYIDIREVALCSHEWK